MEGPPRNSMAKIYNVGKMKWLTRDLNQRAKEICELYDATCCTENKTINFLIISARTIVTL
jgi:hypothetical protein